MLKPHYARIAIAISLIVITFKLYTDISYIVALRDLMGINFRPHQDYPTTEVYSVSYVSGGVKAVIISLITGILPAIAARMLSKRALVAGLSRARKARVLSLVALIYALLPISAIILFIAMSRSFS